jgi:hypothetical protein
VVVARRYLSKAGRWLNDEMMEPKHCGKLPDAHEKKDRQRSGMKFECRDMQDVYFCVETPGDCEDMIEKQEATGRRIVA